MLVVNVFGPVQGVKVGKNTGFTQCRVQGSRISITRRKKWIFSFLWVLVFLDCVSEFGDFEKLWEGRSLQSSVQAFPETISMCVQLRIAFRMSGLVRAQGSHLEAGVLYSRESTQCWRERAERVDTAKKL